jgi:ribosome biogenesis GTPase A
VLNDFRAGALGRLTLETPDEYAAWRRVGEAAEAERQARKR